MLIGDQLNTDKQEIRAEQKKEFKPLTSIFLRPGQNVYSYDPQTNKMDIVKRSRTKFEKGKIKEAGVKHFRPGEEYMGVKTKKGDKLITTHQPSREAIDTLRSEATFDPRKLYCVALNETNAAKKFATQLYNLSKEANAARTATTKE